MTERVAIAVSSRHADLREALAAAGGDVRDDAVLVFADGPRPEEPELTVAVVDDPIAAEEALARGALDVVVWPDDRPRLRLVLARAARRLAERVDLARYRTCFRESGTWLEMADNEVVLTDVSVGFEDATGYARSEAVGRTPAGLFRGGFHPRPHYDLLSSQVVDLGWWKGDLLARQRDGSVVLLETHIGRVMLGSRRVGQFAIKREAGQRRQGALRNWIDDRVSSPWLLTDGTGRILWCGERVARLVGLPREQIVAAPLSVVGVDGPLPPLGQTACRDVWILGRAYEVSLASRELGGVRICHVLFRDVTRLKEEAERLDQLARDLATARDQAQAADRAKSTFLASMSHELRTPLNAILGYSEMIAEQIDEPEAQVDLGRIHAAAVQLLGLVDDVLDLARVESGVYEVTPETLDAREVLAEVADAVRLRAARSGQALELDVGVTHLCGNRQRIIQIMTNLATNATKYAVPGKVVFGARPGELWVEDDGPGLDPVEAERVFEPFLRLHSGGDGVGLGLSLARRLARALGGDLVVSRTPAGGSRFTLELGPAAVVPSPQAEETSITSLPRVRPAIEASQARPRSASG